ncbi:bifunctional glycosyltransferase family 2 protein/CDP-glycerol:glycerophosphate glycerophosphotransferase [Actinomadura barringtoniae]|uniref:Bifunctional glycosyltransferase family 2 protein/CDP-glycerol:glycerophosphate glycerophosphotransferase n=1 Tax=Actinomadura barringtoniae TaxID=1427535 RepID=A0A939T7U9_9ACTN|nr:bifunctional glycosyltransferase family 2 protein/CDP-glycerol:glycerophosphate glycerophosphotransferase [Actinomadura barringtoniae]MBO2452409.1 bifunctional glycosyltransferase family 2 protein/CDP-glycerol:glycerophosphate glycerophosphotransferase [Actinomadura barringtoniae]
MASPVPPPSADPSLSIVIPVHKVQGYLRQCLDSVLDSDLPDVEIVAVDDASPDGCGAILDEFAERDPRVHVLHLDENVGLGEARNIGLGLATGEYVWFFDSDDYAAEGAVRAVHDRLSQTRPDVLVLGHVREQWDGGRTPTPQQRFEGAPDVFTCAERPSVLGLLMTTWNKVIRREYLLGLGLRFSRGYYEDVHLTFPALMEAGRLSLLQRVCYVYRQRRGGAITTSASRRHFDAFPQYERLFAFMDEHDETDPFRSVMFDRVIGHALLVMERDRVLPEDRAEFFGRLSALYKRHRPADHRPPPGRLMKIKHRLLANDAYRRYRFVLFLASARRWALARLGSAKRLARRGLRYGRRRAFRLYYRAQLLAPIDEHLAVYGAYWFRGVACNPKAIYDKAHDIAPDIHGVWVLTRDNANSVPDGIDYVIQGTLAYQRLMARAKYFVNNVNFPNNLIKRPGQIHLMTQHGTPLKKMGLDQLDFPVGAQEMDFHKLITRSDRWDYLISSNPLSTQAWERGYPCHYQMLEIGYPRNDRLVHTTPEERHTLREQLGIPQDKTAILYAPTHREYRDTYQPMFDIGRFTRELGDHYVLLIRAHYFYTPEKQDWDPQHVIDVSDHPSVEDLCIASDALLTDYSSVMFDYALLDGRPIVILANDWDTYRLTRGVNLDITAHPPGILTRTEDELLDAFRHRTPWADTTAKARDAFRTRHCPWDDGHAAERAVRRVLHESRRSSSIRRRRPEAGAHARVRLSSPGWWGGRGSR